MFMPFYKIEGDQKNLVGNAITEMVLYECRHYFFTNDALDNISEHSFIDNKCIINEAEIALVNVHEVIRLVTDTFYSSIEELDLKPEDFVIRKFLQLIKHLKNRKEYRLDLIESVLLYAIADQSEDQSDLLVMQDAQAKVIMYLCETAVSLIQKLQKEKNNKIKAEKIEQELDLIFSLMHAFRSLQNLVEEEYDKNLEIFFCDFDHMLLQENGLLTGSGMLYAMEPNYNIRDIFSSVGESVPVQVEIMLQYIDINRMEILESTTNNFDNLFSNFPRSFILS